MKPVTLQLVWVTCAFAAKLFRNFEGTDSALIAQDSNINEGPTVTLQGNNRGAEALSSRSAVWDPRAFGALNDGLTDLQQLRDAVMLMKEQGGGAEMDAFAASVLNLTGYQLKPNMLAQFVNLSATINATYSSGYAACDNQLTASVGANGSLGQSIQAFTTLGAQHITCRNLQSTLVPRYIQNVVAGYNLSTYQASACANFAALSQSAAGSLTQALTGSSQAGASFCSKNTGETYVNFTARMLSYFQSQNQVWNTTGEACTHATANMSAYANATSAASANIAAQITTCNAMQDQMDTASCSMNAISAGLCSNYSTCYSQFTTSYQLFMQTWNQQHSSLISQWSYILQLECLVYSVMTVPPPVPAYCSNIALIQASAQQSLPLTYPSPVPKVPLNCTVLSNVAGTPSYVTAQYGSLPSAAPAKTCSASCCVASGTVQMALFVGTMSVTVPGVSSTATVSTALASALTAYFSLGTNQTAVTATQISSGTFAISFYLLAASQSSLQNVAASVSSTPSLLATAVASQLTGASVQSFTASFVASAAVVSLQGLSSSTVIVGSYMTLAVTGPNASQVTAASTTALAALFSVSSTSVAAGAIILNSGFGVAFEVSVPFASLGGVLTGITQLSSSSFSSSLTTQLQSGSVSIQAVNQPIIQIVGSSLAQNLLGVTTFNAFVVIGANGATTAQVSHATVSGLAAYFGGNSNQMIPTGAALASNVYNVTVSMITTMNQASVTTNAAALTYNLAVATNLISTRLAAAGVSNSNLQVLTFAAGSFSSVGR